MKTMIKHKKKSIHGVLLLDKVLGASSNQALQAVKRLYGAEKAGHGGTLDPLATGMLIVCFGEATKFSRFLLESDKRYEVTAQLGIKTDTGDSEGKVLEERPVPVLNPAMIESVLTRFRGAITQVPSMYSALKHQGQPLYVLARQGIEVERPARPVHIYDLACVSFDTHTLSLTVHASKGTYVRTLVEDIGEALGCGAHVVALRRTAVGPYTEAEMATQVGLEAMSEDARLACLRPVDSTVTHWPSLNLSEASTFYLLQGQPIMVPYSPTQGWVRLLRKNGDFLGVGEVLEDGRIAPRRLVKAPVMRQAV